MKDFITANVGTIIVSILLIIIVIFAIRSMIKRKKEGKSSCGCDCSSCAMNSSCHRNPK